MNINLNYTKLIFLLFFILYNTFSYGQEDSIAIMKKFKASIVNDEENSFDGGYIVKKGRKYGVVDYDYNLKIPIKYKSIKCYYDSYEYVILNKKKYYGVTNYNYDTVLECKYLRIEELGESFLKIRSKKGIGLYSLYLNKIIIDAKYDSLIMDEELMYDSEATALVYKDGKVGLYALNSEDPVLLSVEFDSIVYVTGEIYDVEGMDYNEYYRVRKNDSILFFYMGYDGVNQIITEGYSRANRRRLEKLNADTIALDGNNGDGMFKARVASSQKWGLYQDYGDSIHVKIPPQFDSIVNYSWNAPFTLVANNDRWGIYLWEWGDSVDYNRDIPCLYEECKRVKSSSSGRFYLAAKLDGYWFWVDWYTGKRTTKQVWKTYDEMTLSYYDRSSYYSN